MISLIIKSPHGIHARPASEIVNLAQTFKSEIVFIKDDNEYNAKSIMNIMGMGLAQGDEIQLKAKGPDQAEAEEKIAALIEATVA